MISAANRLLKDIPGVVHFHAGKTVPSQRPVVEQSYQAALNIAFTDRAAEHEYQTHPQHMEFVEKYVRGFVRKVVVYDFE